MSGAITQSGPVVAGRVAMFLQDGVVEDGGPAAAGLITQVGITNPGGLALAINSGTIAAEYTQLGFSVGTNGGVTMSVESFNGGPDATLTLELNGVSYPFPGAGNGDVIGPGTVVSGNLASWNGTNGSAIKDSGLPAAGVMVAVATIALLRASTAPSLPTGICFVTGYASPADGGEGAFVVKGSDTTSADNGGTIIVDLAGRRWYRLTESQPYSVTWFGATGNGITDDTLAFNNCIAAVAALGANFPLAVGGKVRVPGGRTYLIAETVSVSTNGIVIQGDGQLAAVINFTNGSADCITVEGTSTSPIQGCAIRDLYLTFTGKTGGRAIYAAYSDNVLLENMIIINPWALIDLWVNNTVITKNVWVENLTGGAGSYAVRWRAPSDGSGRSDYLVLEDVAVDGHYTGADGLILDGLVATLMVTRSNLLRMNHTVQILNTGSSAAYYPNFMHFTDFSTEGALSKVVDIQSGQFFKFTACDLSNNVGASGQGGADTNAVTISLDPEVLTRSVQFIGCWIAGSTQSAMVSQAFSVRLIGNEFEQFNGTGSNLYPAIEVQNESSDHIILGNVSFVFGSPNTWKYGLQVDAGAFRLIEDDNNWTNAQTAPINWLTTDLQSYAGTDVQNSDIAAVNAATAFWQGLVVVNSFILTPDNILNYQLGLEGTPAAFTMTTPTAAQLVAAFPSPSNGKILPLLITNGTAVTATMQSNTGVQFNGITAGPTTFTIASATTRLFFLRFNSVNLGSESVEIRG